MEAWGGLILLAAIFAFFYFTDVLDEITKWLKSKREAQDLQNREKRIELDEREGRQKGGE